MNKKLLSLNIRFLLLTFFMLLSLVSKGQTNLFQFDFEGSSLNPNINNTLGNPSLTPINVGTIQYPSYNTCGSGNSRSLSTNDWDTNDYYLFKVNTVGYANMVFSYCNEASDANINNYAVFVSPDQGATYSTIVNSYIPNSASTVTSITLPESANNNPDVWIRIFKTNNPTGNRTFYIDNVTLRGHRIPTISSFTPNTACSTSGASVIISGTNFSGATAVNFNGVTATSYTVNSNTQITAQLPATATTGAITVVTSGGTATSSSSFTVNAVTGNQTSYGANSWIGYVYANTNGGNPPSNAFTTNYVGYITQLESFDLNLVDGALSGANLCSTYADNFAIQFKMNKNMPAGNYTFNVGGDDGYRLSLDGGATYVITNWNTHAYQNTTQTFYLSGNTNFVLEYFENAGQSRVQFSYTFCQGYSIAGASAVSTACTNAKSSIVTLNSTVSGLPVGNYTVSYSLSFNGNSAVYTAPMTVSSAGTGQFAASLAPMSANNSTTITITNLASGSCSSAISSSNTSNIVNVYAPITPVASAGFASCSTWNAQWNNDTFVSGYFLDVATTNNFTAGSFLAGFQDLNVGNVITYPITGLSPGVTYYYRVRNNNLGCGVSINSNVISFIAGGAVAPTGITGTISICSGSSTTLTLTGGTAAGGTARWYSGSCGGTLVGTGNSITVSPTNTTTYFVRYEGGCNTTTCASRIVTVNPQPTAANAGPDQSEANANSFILAANTSTAGTGVWTIVSGPSTLSSQFSNTASPMATFTPVTPGTYVLNWAISTSCGSSSDQVVITNNCATNLISNGNFNGGIAGWTKATTQGSYVEVNPENTYFSNNNTGATSELDSEASLRQVLTVIPGVSYTVSFLYARRLSTSTPLTTGVTVKVTGGTSDIISTGFTSTNSTAQIATFTFTATSASIGLEFYNTLSGSSTYGTIIDDIVLLPASQVAPTAVTNPRGNFNTSSSCAGVPVSLDVLNVPLSGVNYSWTGTAGAVFSATNIKNPTVIFTGSGLQQATVTVIPAGGCSVTSTTYVNVAAAPVITAPLATAVCSGSTFSSGAITSTGTNYNWSRAAVANINGGAANTGGTNITGTGFSEVLTNSSTSPINVTYVLIPRSTSSACAGIPYNLVITVNPSIAVPTLGAITQPNCVVPTGSIPLSGLPSSGSWTIIASPAAGLTGLTGTGETTIVGGLVAGTTYTFAVSNGTCTSPVSSNILIKSLPLVAKYNGSWTNGPPTIEQSIVFEGNYTSVGNLQGCDCTVNAGVQVNVLSGHTLKITNAVKVNTAAGTSLTFQDDASLVQVNDDAINAGVISYIRINSTTRETDYTYWSSPVAGQILSAVSPNTPSGFFYSFNATEDNWNYAPPSTVMGVGTGYIIRGPKIVGIPPPPPTPHKATFKGVPNNGKIEFLGVIKDRSYLLGNPYPSALSANRFITDNSAVLDGTLYFWTHMTPIGDAVFNPGSGVYAYSSNDYATYNLTGGLATNPGSAASQSVSAKPTGEIAAGQAFFTSSRLDPTNNTIVFNNRMRLDVNDAIMDNSQFFKVKNTSKKTDEIEKHRVWLNLTNTQGAFKQMLVGYLTGATNGYDSSFDGPSYNGNEFIDFYSIADDESLAIQGRALPFDSNDTVPLGYSSAIESSFSISIDEVDGLLVAQNIYLEDKLNNTIHNLTKEGYTFQTTAGTFDDRFVLRYTDKTLGVENFDTINKQVLVSVKNKQLKINSTTELIDKVFIYDVLGKQLYEKNNVENKELIISNIGSSEQVLIVKTVLQNGIVITAKMIY